jgi:hypothetical protein
MRGFKPCPGFDRYFVNTDGDVLYINRRGALKSVHKGFRRGCVIVKIRKTGESETREIHVISLIRKAFGEKEATIWKVSQENPWR